MTGEGFYDPDMRQDIQDLYDLDASQTMSFEIKSDPPSAGTDGYYTGKWFFTELGINAEFGQFGRSNMTFEADGEITWVAAP